MNILIDKMALFCLGLPLFVKGLLNRCLYDLLDSRKVIVLHAKVILVSEYGLMYQQDGYHLLLK